MPTEVEIPDIGIVEFPDAMSERDISDEVPRLIQRNNVRHGLGAVSQAINLSETARAATNVGIRGQIEMLGEERAAKRAKIKQEIEAKSEASPVWLEKTLGFLGNQGAEVVGNLANPVNLINKTVNAIAGRPVVSEYNGANLEGLIQQPVQMVEELTPGMPRGTLTGPDNPITGVAKGAEEIASGFTTGEMISSLPAFAAGPELALLKTGGKAVMAGGAIKSVPESIKNLQQVASDPDATKADIAKAVTGVVIGSYIATKMAEQVPTSLPGVAATSGKTLLPTQNQALDIAAKEMERQVRQGELTGGESTRTRQVERPETFIAVSPDLQILAPQTAAVIEQTTTEVSNAKTIRTDTGQLREPGKAIEGGEADRSDDLQLAPSGTPNAPGQAEVSPEVKAPVAADVENAPLRTEEKAEPAVEEPTPSAPVEQPNAQRTEAAVEPLTPVGGEPTAAVPTTPAKSETTKKVVEKQATPSAAVDKVEAEVKSVAKTEGARSAKEVKSELVDRLEKAIEEAKPMVDVIGKEPLKIAYGVDVKGKTLYHESTLGEHMSETVKRNGEDVPKYSKEIQEALEIHGKKVTIDIPGDGTFRIWNTKEALSEVLERAKKIPTSSTEPTKVKVRNISKADREWVQQQVKSQEKAEPAEVGPGMGGAIPSEFERSPELATSIKNAVVDKERAKRGLPPAMQPAKRSFGEVWDRAMALIDHDPEYQQSLINQLRENPHAVTDIEDAILLHRQIDLQNEYGKATRDLAQAYEDGRMEAVATEKARVSGLSDQLLDLYNINKKVGTATGRGLNARKMMAYEDFTLAKMELEKRAAKGGAPLTDAERSEVVRLNKKIEETQKAYDDYVAATTAKEAQRAVQDALDEVEQAARKEQPPYHPRVLKIAEQFATYMEKQADSALARIKERRGRLTAGIDPTELADLSIIGAAKLTRGVVELAKWSEAMIRDVGDWIKPHLDEIRKASEAKLETESAQLEKKHGKITAERVKRAPKDAATKEAEATTKIKERIDSGKRDEITPLVQKLARAFVETGIREREALIDAVHGVLESIDPSFTRRETMDAISGYGDFKQLTKDEISVQLRDLKGQMQQVAKLEDMQAGQAPQKTGVERRSPSDEERRLIKLVNEAKKKGGFVVTDPATQLASALTARKTYYRNRISDLKQEIETREKLVKTKTPSPTDPQLEAMKKEYEALKAEHEEIFKKPGLTDEQRLALAEKVATRQIAELERQLKTGEIFPAGKKPFLGTSPALEAAKARIEALKAEREYARELIQTSPQPLDVEAQRRTAVLDKRIDELEKQIEHETVFPKGKTEKVETPENAERIKRLDELKEQRKFIRERLQPKPERDPEAIALKGLKARLARQTADLKDRLSRGDFSKKQKRIIPMDSEANRLHYEMSKAKVAWHEALMKDRLANRSLPRKVFDTAGEVLNLSRAVVTSSDFSGVLRQGGFIAFAHPIRAAKSFPAMFRAFRSEAGQHAVDQEILARKNYPIYQQGKLYLSEHGHKLSQMEEAYMSRWVDKIPKLSENMGIAGKIALSPITIPGKVVASSQRAYVTFLNKLRADSFDAMSNSLARDGKELTPTEVNAIANFVNVATGRGNLGMKENALVGLNTVFFAPRYVASRFQLLAGQPLYRGSARTRTLMAKEYGRFLAGAAVVYGLAQMDGATIEQDPRSADFGKLRYGNTRIDPMAGLLQNTVLLSRLGSGETKTSKGNIVPIRGPKVPYGAPNAADVTARFLRSKLSPAIGTGLNLLTGKDVVGQPVTPESTASNLLVPLSLQDIYSTMREQGIERGTIFALLSIFGMGLQNYEQRKTTTR